MNIHRPSMLAAALLLGVTVTGAAAESSAKDAAKQFGRAVGKAGSHAGRQVGQRAKRDAPPALRSLRDANHAFWQKRKAEAKQALGKLRGGAQK